MGDGPSTTTDQTLQAKAQRYERIVAFDLETTGLDPEEHRIVEISMIVLDRQLQELDRWSELINPQRPIPNSATTIHGIANQDVRDAPTFDVLAPVIQSMVQPAILMAYNHDFDRSFLHAELTHCGGPGIPEGHPFIDPMVPFKEHVPQTRNTLGEAVQHYLGTTLDGAHRAEADTEAMVEVLRKQWEAHPQMGDTLEDLIVQPKDWVDPAKKLYKDDQGRICYGFGKHEGTPVEDEPGYAEWMLGKDFEDGTKEILRSLL